MKVSLVKTGAKKRGMVYVSNLNAKTSVEVNRNQLLQILDQPYKWNVFITMDGREH